LLARREQLIGMITAETNRRQQLVAERLVKQQVDAHILWLQRQLTGIETELDGVIRETPLWRATANLLASVPGVGPAVIRTLLLELPELGRLTRRESAPWSGWLQSRGTAARCGENAAFVVDAA
jgi:transposase